MKVERQVRGPISSKGIGFDEGFWADIIVEKKVLLDLKSVEQILAAYKKQVQTYLRLSGLKLGYLLNFGEDFLNPLREWTGGMTLCASASLRENYPLKVAKNLLTGPSPLGTRVKN